tara:strand:- start:117 stop:311 length:195 start_codon:yes stop_codon:yes gene_type:complete
MMHYKRLNDIDTFSCNDGEILLSGKDERGEALTFVFCAYDFLSWIGTDEIKHIKEQTIKHIKKL